MSKIYTKTGDRGDTGLWGGGRLRKDHPRVEAYGEVDELNSSLGAVLASLPREGLGGLEGSLRRIQKELFTIGAILASPAEKSASLAERLPASAVSALEAEIDAWTAELKPLKKFILPGGSTAGAQLHLARTVCRRAERRAVALAEREAVPERLIVYLNRLSDHLFTAARWANQKLERTETEWEGLN